MCEEDARIVDQYVEATELLRGEVHGAAYRLGIRDLRLDLHMSFAGQGGDDLRGCRGGAAVVHGHPITPGREGRGHRGSDPTRTSGHQPVDVVVGGVRREPGSYGTRVTEPDPPGRLDRIEAAGRRVYADPRQVLGDLVRCQPGHRVQRGRGATLRTSVQGDSVDRAEPVEQPGEQTVLVLLDGSHRLQDPGAAIGRRRVEGSDEVDRGRRSGAVSYTHLRAH